MAPMSWTLHQAIVPTVYTRPSRMVRPAVFTLWWRPNWSVTTGSACHSQPSGAKTRKSMTNRTVNSQPSSGWPRNSSDSIRACRSVLWWMVCIRIRPFFGSVSSMAGRGLSPSKTAACPQSGNGCGNDKPCPIVGPARSPCITAVRSFSAGMSGTPI